ncbi:MAG: autotransporter domain-containing protein [Roseinatronobacter sp.]
MKRLASTAALSMALALGYTAASANELRFDRLHIIGDSLSDGGAYSQAVQAGSGGLLPNINYKWLTNAPDGSSLTYGEVLARNLGLTLRPNILNGVPAAGLADIVVGGTNYAEGGSRVSQQPGIGNNPVLGITTIPLTTQVDRLLAANPRLNANDLVILWGGANDVFAQSGAVGGGFITPAMAAANMAQAATDLIAQVGRVRAAGGETIIVVTVPDIGTTPFGISQGPAGSALLTGLSNAFNAQLSASLNGAAVIVDAGKLLGAIQADPAKYGFTAPNAATIPACGAAQSLSCVIGLNASVDSEQRVFADGVHPTTRAHAVFGQAAFAGLQAATQTGAIAVATMTALRQQNLSIENRMNPTALLTEGEDGRTTRREVGHVDVYATLEAGSYKSRAQQVTPGLSGSTQVAKFGFDVAVAPNASLGAGLSFDRGKVTFDGNRGGFDQRLLVGALFGQIAINPTFYVNAALGGGTIDVRDITRSFAMGTATETYRAQTKGSYRFARIGGGAILPMAQGVVLNPFAHYTHERVSINGFTESAGAASLSFGQSTYTARRVTLGLSANLAPVSMPEWKFNFRGSIEHDLNKSPLFVSLGPTAATLGAVSAPRPDRTWGYVSATAVRELGGGASLNFGLSASVGQSGTKGYVGAIGFKTRF